MLFQSALMNASGSKKPEVFNLNDIEALVDKENQS